MRMRMRGPKRRATMSLALFMGIIAAAPPVSAGSFQVNPVNLVMPTGRNATSVTIKNSDTSPVAVRVLAYRWTQQDGQDVYSETSDVIASPPIFTIGAGQTQLVRVGLRKRDSSKAYRVIVEE